MHKRRVHIWLLDVPRIKKPKTHIKEFNYLKDKNEIERLLAKAREEGYPVFIFYLTAITTGMRAGELAGLKWHDVDFDNRLITVARSFDSTTKNGEIRRIPILNQLLSSLSEWKLQKTSEWVFINEAGNPYGAGARIYKSIFHRVLKTANLSIRFHDLRHTFASHWMINPLSR